MLAQLTKKKFIWAQFTYAHRNHKKNNLQLMISGQNKMSF